MSDSSSMPQKRRPKFGLRFLLLLVLLVAVALGAFQLGHDVGYDEGNQAGFAEGINEKVFAMTYRVSDVLPPEADSTVDAKYQKLIDEIVKEVQPLTWDTADGPASLAPYPQNRAIVVSQTTRGHDELADFLESKRR